MSRTVFSDKCESGRKFILLNTLRSCSTMRNISITFRVAIGIQPQYYLLPTAHSNALSRK